MIQEPAGMVLDMLADTINAINNGESGDAVVVTHLCGALDATCGVSVYADQDNAYELIAAHPDEATATALFHNIRTLGPSGLNHHVMINRVPGIGHVVYVVIPPDPEIAPEGGFGRIIAFARQEPYDEDSAQLLQRACRPLQALWPQTARAYARKRASNTDFELTAREIEVLNLLARGLLATSIASRLKLSPRTVHKHLGNIYRKLGVHDRLVAVTIARASGLLSPAAVRKAS